MEDWPYALIVKQAKLCGGPQKLLELTYVAGVNKGMQQMAPVVSKTVTTSSVISSIATICTIGAIGTVYYFVKKKRRSKQELAKNVDRQTIAHLDMDECRAK